MLMAGGDSVPRTVDVLTMSPRVHRRGYAPTTSMRPDILGEVFQKMCNWTAPDSFLQSVADSNYSLPLVVEASMEHCGGTTLPWASEGLWSKMADVIITKETSAGDAKQQLRRCNSDGERACIIFVETIVLYRREAGWPELILRIVQKPFVLITTDRYDHCVPTPHVPAQEGERSVAIQELMDSQLLIR
jgi:hypothetical protein